MDLLAPAGWAGRGFAPPGDTRAVPPGKLRFMAAELPVAVAALSPAAEGRLSDATAVAMALGIKPEDMASQDPVEWPLPNRILTLREGQLTALFVTFLPEDQINPEVNGVLHLCPKGAMDCAQSPVGRFQLGSVAKNMRLALGLSQRIFAQCA